MSYHIKDWLLEEDYEHYKIENGELAGRRVLPKLAKINIFVGANNSGKSRFLRKMAATSQVNFHPHLSSKEIKDEFSQLQNIRDGFVSEMQLILQRARVKRTSAMADFDPEHALPTEFVTENVDAHVLKRRLLEIEKGAISYEGAPAPQTTTDIKNIAARYKQKAEQYSQNLPAKYTFKKIYFPTLRGLRFFSQAGNEDLYHAKTREDYFSQAKVNVEIFTGQTMYRQVHDLLTGTYSERKKVAGFEDFISRSFFQGTRFTLIPNKSGFLYVKIGDEKEFPIHDLGDGIQSIIILTFPLFMNAGSNLLAFFEEPELYMHPGIQRVFLEALNRFPNFQYFMTTHSNHFLDITLDTSSASVYTFTKAFAVSEHEEKEAQINITNVSNEDHVSLELLGVRNSSVFLSNCTIWVEGITDRRYLSKYLSLYQNTLPPDEKRFKEDMHFSFVEYGGSNITHWSFLDKESDAIEVERLCGKLMLITDRDSIGNTAKQARHAKLKEKLKERYCCLECREIENLLMPDTLKKVIAEYEGSAIFNGELKQESYANEPLGKFIETKILNGNKKRAGSYATESGTVTNKIQFCDKALKHLTQFDDLSPEAKRITIALYTFIKANNG